MRSVLIPSLAILASIGLVGCKKTVPNDIIQKSFTNALRHAPNTASAMCGANTRGFTSVRVTVTKKLPENKGSVHVKGTPWFGPGVPSECEGDIDYAYSYQSKTRKVGRNTRTDTTWYLDQMTLTAVQTKGVTFKSVNEQANEDEEDDTAATGSAAGSAPPAPAMPKK
jgi:hypothetical protein